MRCNAQRKENFVFRKKENKMKTKKIQKKLELNKQTIATLGRDEMADVKAGCFTPFTPWITIITELLGCNNNPDTANTCPGKVLTLEGPYC